MNTIISYVVALCSVFAVSVPVIAQLTVSSMPLEPMNIAVTNYTNLDAVQRFERFELGVALQNDLTQKIQRFTSDEPGEKLNPYLDWEIRVVAEFRHPELGDPIEIDGFYYATFKGQMKHPLPEPQNRLCYSDAEYANLGKYVKKENDYPFRIRFAPPKEGVWECRLKVILPNKEQVSEPFTFTVVAGDNEGYVQVGEDGRYFARGDKGFVPAGCNMPWPQTQAEFDPEFANNNRPDGKVIMEENYRPNHLVPRVYRSYRKMMDRLADGGGNYFRMIMYPSGTDIEWEELGNYTDRLSMAQELDSILEKAEERDLYIQWNMQIHYTFQMSEHAYFTRWAWNRKVDGYDFCYKTIPGVESELDFFTNDIAKRYYKQRLRYIISRWGYSTNIALFELFSEISNVGTREADASNFYASEDNWKLSRNWQLEMADYIKSMYLGRVHLLTGSYAGTIHNDDDIYESELMDLAGINIYDYEDPSFAEGFWNKFVSGRYLNDECEELGAFMVNCDSGELKTNTKPLIFSETGVSPDAPCRSNRMESNRAMWHSTFSGLAACLSYDAWFTPENFDQYGRVNTFMSQFNISKDNWHPGASKLVPHSKEARWVYSEKYASGMDGDFSPNRMFPWKKRERKANCSYLRSGDGTRAIGVISNKTYNVGNTEDCYEWQDIKGTALEFPEAVNTKDERIQLHGMESGKYTVSFYYPSNLEMPFLVTTSKGSAIKLDCELQASLEGFLVLFVAEKIAEE